MLKKINNLKTTFYTCFFVICVYGFIFTSCKSKPKYDYIISKEDSIYKTTHTRPDGIVLLPPNVRFGRYNFIIDSVYNVYFYSFQEPKQISGVSDEIEDKLAYLKPNYLFKIPRGLEPIFFVENVVLQKTSEKIKTINVASFNDTIKTDFIKYLKNIQRKDSSGYSLKIRRVLPEERQVLTYKLAGKPYFPHYREKDSSYKEIN